MTRNGNAPAFVWRVITSHMVTYFLVGLVAFYVFDYRHLYADTDLRHLMRPTSSAWVALGPVLQIVRGTVFGLVLLPFAAGFREKYAALRLWALFVGLAVLGAAGPAPGSLEGLLFTTLPFPLHLIGLPEVILQTGAFSFLLVHWYRHPARWKNVVGIGSVLLIAAMSVMGALAALGKMQS